MSATATVGQAIVQARRRLAAAGFATAALEARLLAAYAFGCEVPALIGHGERELDTGRSARLQAAVSRRLDHEPLAYILGEKEFWSLSLRVTADTLVPRPETETLVEAALAWQGRRDGAVRILDIGTGSGCLLLALLSNLPSAWGVGLDCSEPALAVARDNADRLGLADRSAFACTDWTSGIAGPFDLVVCNPPYVADGEWTKLAPDIREFEPPLALRGGPDGLAAYRLILPRLPSLFAAGGAAFVELGVSMAQRVADLAAAAGLQPSGPATDLAGRPRCLRLSAIDPQNCKKDLGNQMSPL
jgi:release factor glutamine methyltransferase